MIALYQQGLQTAILENTNPASFYKVERRVLWPANALPTPVQSSAATWTSMGKSAQEKMRAHRW
jgi:hypothetical protein